MASRTHNFEIEVRSSSRGGQPLEILDVLCKRVNLLVLVIIDTIGIGTPEGALIPNPYGGFIKEKGEPVRSKLDGSTLKKMAEVTGGMFLRVDSSSDGLDNYLERLKKRQTRNFGNKTEVLRHERFGLFLIAAAAFFLLGLVFEEIDKRR